MATEIQEKAPVGDQQSKGGRQSAETLQPSLEDYQSYQNKNKPGSDSAPKNDQAKKAYGNLEIVDGKAEGQQKSGPFGKDKQDGAESPEDQKADHEVDGIDAEQKDAKDKKDPLTLSPEEQKVSDKQDTPQSPEEQRITDKLDTPESPKAPKVTDKLDTPESPKVQEVDKPNIPLSPEEQKANHEVKDTDDSAKDGQDVVLSPEAQKAKDDFIKVLESRFKDDPRFRDNPQALKDVLGTLEAKLNQMDKRVLNEHVAAKRGCDESLKTKDGEIDQQKQLTTAYQSLTRIGKDAEKLTLKDSDEKVFNESWMVNNVLAGAIVRGVDPAKFDSQGNNNTCATTSIDKQMMDLMIGKDLQTAADVCTKGEFQTVDKAGKTFTCQVHRESLRPDEGARDMHLGLANARDAYGQVTDIRTAQLNLDLYSRGSGGAAGDLTYKEVSPTSQRDTGERVMARNGEIIAENPCINAERASLTKQSLFGRFIDPKFGKETTLVNEEQAAVMPDTTGITDGAEMTGQLTYLHENGWDLPYTVTHVSKYVGNAQGLGGAQDSHASVIELAKEGGVNFHNSWGGAYNFSNLNANQLVSWMQEPKALNGGYTVPVFNADPAYSRNGSDPVQPNPEKLADHKPESEHSEKDRLQQEKRRADKEEALAETKRKETYKQELARIELARINQVTGSTGNDGSRSDRLVLEQLWESEVAV